MVEVPKGLKIFVIYTDGSIREYKSEEKAYYDINLCEHSASGVKAVIVGNKLGMLTEKCERFLCFVKGGKNRCVNSDDNS